MVQTLKKNDSTIDDSVESDIFEEYRSPDINDAVNKRNIYNVMSIVTKASAIMTQYGFLYEAVMAYYEVGTKVGGTPENPILEYDLTGVFEHLGIATMFFTIGMVLWYGGNYLRNKYDEKSQLLNILIGKREEKRLEHYLKKKEISY